MSLKYRTSAGTSASNFTDLVVKVGDTLPIGTEVDYDGQTAPAGWQEVDDPNVYSTSETKIGTWNGKPLYRKIVEFTSPTGNTSSVSVPALAIPGATVRNYHAINVTSGGYAINENYQESAYALLSMAIRLENGNVYFPQHSSITSATSITLVVEYTKSTD